MFWVITKNLRLNMKTFSIKNSVREKGVKVWRYAVVYNTTKYTFEDEF